MRATTRRDLLRRAAVGGTATVALGGSAAANESAGMPDGQSAVTTHATYAVGDPVFTTSDLNVRDGPGLGYTRLATADKRTGGEVEGGPQTADGYTWWKVSFSGDGDNGPVTGWVAGNWLDRANFDCPMTGTVTSTYWDCRDGCDRYHRAVDIADGGGTPIVAAAGGTTEHRYDEGGYGNWLLIYHGNGWKTGYGHLSSFAVGDGVTVERGQTVAYEGDTGAGTGPHLDFQVWDPDWAKRRSYYDKYDETIAGTGVPRAFY